MSQYKLIAFVFAILLLIPLVAALDFDNVKSYDAQQRKVTVTNAFGLGDDIATVKLNTPLVYNVMRGKDRLVAEFTIDNKGKSYKGAFKQMQFYDVKDNMREFQRDFTYKYKTYSNVVVPDYEQVCSQRKVTFGNGTSIMEDYDCVKTQVGSHTEQREVWNVLDKDADLATGEITIGIFTDVKAGESVDWVPTLFGVRIPEWAVWTEALNNDLLLFYSLDNSTGTTSHDFGPYNNTGDNPNMNDADWVEGLLGNALDFDGTNDYIDVAHNYGLPIYTTSGSNPWSLSMWVNTSTGSGNVFAMGRASSDTPLVQFGNSGDKLRVFIRNDGGGTVLNANSAADVYDGNWKHLVWVDDNGAVLLYVDGVLDSTNFNYSKQAITLDTTAFGTHLGTTSNGDYTGLIDEMGIWNRTLTPSEVSDLYNGGTGISYTPPTDPSEINITLDSPANNTITSIAEMNFSINQTATSEFNNTNATLMIWNSSGSLINESTQALTEQAGSEIVNWNRFAIPADGDYYWNALACGQNYTAHKCKYDSLNLTFILDTTNPTITINDPTGQTVATTELPKNVTFNATSLDSNLDSCSYWTDEIDVNQTYTCNTNQIISFNNSGNHTIYAWANDSAGLSSTQSSSVFINYISESVAYDDPVISGSTGTFYLNLTADTITNSSAIIRYNNTEYTMTQYSSNATFAAYSRQLISPKVPSQKNITFNFTYYVNDLNLNSSSYSQELIVINMSLLGNPYTVEFINVTVYDEDSLEKLNATFEGTWTYSSGVASKTFAYENLSETEPSFSFALDPAHLTYNISADIEFGAGSHVSETFTMITTEFTNASTSIPIYLLNSSRSTTFIIKVRDSAYDDVIGGIVEVERYYPGDNTWKVVETVTTNFEGKALGHFIQEDVSYRFKVYIGGDLELTSSSTKVFCEAAPCTITLTLPGTARTAGTELDALNNLTQTLSYNTTTSTFTYQFTDIDPTAQGGRLKVIRIDYGNFSSTTMCDDATTSTTATLSCDISSELNGTYLANAYNNRTTDESRLVNSLVVNKIRDIIGQIGADGLLWSAFLMMGIIMLGLFKPAAAIIFTMFSLIMVGLLGIASIPAISIVSIIFIGIFILWGMRQ